MKSGYGVGATMLAIAIAVAACEHEAQRDTTANAPRPVYFESVARAPRPFEPQPQPRVTLARTSAAGDDDEAPRAGRTDRFLWDDRSVPETLDGGGDASPHGSVNLVDDGRISGSVDPADGGPDSGI